MKVYPAKFWGDNVTIIANRNALLQLKKTIDAALNNEPDYDYEYYFCDDNNYAINVKCLSDDATHVAIDVLPAHYDDGDMKLTEEEEDIINNFYHEHS
jgi:hypothetical protein